MPINLDTINTLRLVFGCRSSKTGVGVPASRVSAVSSAVTTPTGRMPMMDFAGAVMQISNAVMQNLQSSKDNTIPGLQVFSRPSSEEGPTLGGGIQPSLQPHREAGPPPGLALEDAAEAGPAPQGMVGKMQNMFQGAREAKAEGAEAEGEKKKKKTNAAKNAQKERGRREADDKKEAKTLRKKAVKKGASKASPFLLLLLLLLLLLVLLLLLLLLSLQIQHKQACKRPAAHCPLGGGSRRSLAKRARARGLWTNITRARMDLCSGVGAHCKSTSQSSEGGPARGAHAWSGSEGWPRGPYICG